MGSNAFKAKELPDEVKQRIDKAMDHEMTIIVGETHGAGRAYQDYLHRHGYRRVIVGHAVRLRYNVGGWEVVKYGRNLKEREKAMIEDCDSAIVIWVNHSGVIAQNLERLKRLGKPTFLYECFSDSDEVVMGPLDPQRIYDDYYGWKEAKRQRGGG